jgi:hypothetical protein
MSLMKAIASNGLALFVGILLTLIAVTTPLIGRAQTVAPADDLSATIRTAITSDPRSAHMSKKQIDSMVLALSKQAAKQGVTSHDIAWRPSEVPSINSSATFGTPDTCGGLPQFLCTTENAFGITGGNTWILVGLGLLAGLLIIFIAEMLVMHHRKTAE